MFCMMQYRYGKHRSYSQAQIIQVPVIEDEGIYLHVSLTACMVLNCLTLREYLLG